MPFDKKLGPKLRAEYQSEERRYGERGNLTTELNWLKNVRDQTAVIHRGWIKLSDWVPLARECGLAGAARSTSCVRNHPKEPAIDVELCHELPWMVSNTQHGP